MGEHDDLLKRFQPVLRYDSNEQFFADSAEQYMVTPGTTLRRKRTATGKRRGPRRAPSRRPASPSWRSTSSARRPTRDGSEVLEGDHIGLRGKRLPRAVPRACAMAHPGAQQRRLRPRDRGQRARSGCSTGCGTSTTTTSCRSRSARTRATGRWCSSGWTTQAGQPDIAIYAQHRYGEVRPWDKVEKLGDRPVVYVARGSHASYFEAGFHQTEAWYDLADGKRRMKDRPALEILDTDDPAWTRWPGRWGDTLPRSGVESNSPTGPGAKKQWTAPGQDARQPAARSPSTAKGATAPEVRALRAGGRLRVEYDVTQARAAPAQLVVTVNSEDEAGVPPQTHQHRRARQRPRQGHDRRRARPAQALRRVHEHDRRRSAGAVGVHARRDRAVRRIEAGGLAAPARAGDGQHGVATIRGDRW